MPILRTLTTKIKTKISPSTSPSTSPTSPESSFQVVSGRKEGGATVKRPETYPRMDSFMGGSEKGERAGSSSSTSSSAGEGEFAERKQRRMSRFREELDVGDD